LYTNAWNELKTTSIPVSVFILYRNGTIGMFHHDTIFNSYFIYRYSYRNDFTGFALAALQDCHVTVSNATLIAKSAAIIKISVSNFM